jgi:hypothetical protein
MSCLYCVNWPERTNICDCQIKDDYEEFIDWLQLHTIYPVLYSEFMKLKEEE